MLLGMIILQMDVIGAYLESALSQNHHLIYMTIPKTCKIGWDELVCKIINSLYGLKQVERLWNKTFIKFFRTVSFTPTNGDSYILTYREGDVLIILEVYVDDFALASQSEDGLNWLKHNSFKNSIWKIWERPRPSLDGRSLEISKYGL